MIATLTEQRSRLRRLISQIDLDEQLRKRATQQAISEAEVSWRPFWTLRSDACTYNGSSASARVIERILSINRNAAGSDRDDMGRS